MNTNTLNTQIYEEASEWMILHRSDDLDAEAKRRFDAWLRESPQHLKAYLEMSTIWEDVPTLQHDWNPSANELIARAREDSNVFPLDRVPGTGGFGDIGTVPQVAAAPEQAVVSLEHLKGLEPLEALEALSSSEQNPTSTEPALQSVPVVTVPASQSRLMKLLAIAATLLLTAGVSTWFFLQRNVYSTDIGEQRTLALEDGSSVELNARTKIRVAYTDRERTIELLQGQALFKVAKDPNRPFIVESDETRVRAVGTQFDVYKKNSGTQITVVEGRVAVRSSTVPGSGVSGVSGPSRPGEAKEGDTAAEKSGGSPRVADQHASSALQAQLGEVLVSAGEQVLVAQNAPEFAIGGDNPVSSPQASGPSTQASVAAAVPVMPAPQPANIEAATAWTQQRLVFDFTPLTEVAHEFNRYNRRPLIIEDATLSDFNVSGSFSSTDPTLLLRFLREQPGIVVNESHSEIRISHQDTITG